MLDLQKVDDLLDEPAMPDFLGPRRTIMDKLPKEVRMHFEDPTGHDVVEGRHSLEQSDVLEGPRNPICRRFARAQLVVADALEDYGPMLGLVEPVDDVEH